ncbi:MAG TPA: hypothetical protein VLJ86_02450 [Ramlibacter sp.]|nr:hypothetical protein [Ramlibacter sp.]
MRRVACVAAVALALSLAGCSNAPPQPDWQVQAHGDLARFETAYLTGAMRAAQAEFARARSALAATGEARWVARAELTRCALQVASLAFEPCVGFEALRQDAPAAERAYAQYLAGEALAPEQSSLLPAHHRAVAVGAADPAASLLAIADPLARLVAAGVVMRMGRATPQSLQLAADTASQQGWRRPLLAWLGVQAQRAEQAGDGQEAQRLRRRMALAGGARD